MNTKDNMITDISAELEKNLEYQVLPNVPSSMKKHTLSIQGKYY